LTIEERERALRARLKALLSARGPSCSTSCASRTSERAGRIKEFWGHPASREFGELLIDLEEERAARAAVFGLLAEMERGCCDGTEGRTRANRPTQTTERPLREPSPCENHHHCRQSGEGSRPDGLKHEGHIVRAETECRGTRPVLPTDRDRHSNTHDEHESVRGEGPD
jgi:hypothetical protein